MLPQKYQSHSPIINMSNQDSEPDMKLFWGCFIALITTAFAFITRAFLVNAAPFWPSTFGLDQVQAQELFGAGIWPFAISIIVFSLIIDNIGYRAAMIFSFICYALYAFFAFQAYGVVMAEGLTGEALITAQADAYISLLPGISYSGLGNGTVEAFINPVVATMFKKDKTKWLNILHAGWPGGLVIGGVPHNPTWCTSSRGLENSYLSYRNPCRSLPGNASKVYSSLSMSVLNQELPTRKCLLNLVPLVPLSLVI